MAAGDRQWEKWAPITGIVFVAAFLGLFFAVPGTPENASTNELVKFYKDNEFRLTWLPYFLIAVGGPALIWFVGSLRRGLVEAEGGATRLSSIVFGSGVAAAVLFLAASSMFGAGPAAYFAGPDNFKLDVDTVTLIETAGFNLFLFFAIAGGLMIAAASLLALRTRLWPAWWSWLGFLFALALFFDVFYFFGFLLLLLWVLVVSILLIRGGGRLGRAAS
jgi:hypothetical protein